MGVLMQLHTGDVAPLLTQLLSFFGWSRTSEPGITVSDRSASGHDDDGDNAYDRVGADVQAPYCLLLGALVLLQAVSGACELVRTTSAGLAGPPMRACFEIVMAAVLVGKLFASSPLRCIARAHSRNTVHLVSPPAIGVRMWQNPALVRRNRNRLRRWHHSLSYIAMGWLAFTAATGQLWALTRWWALDPTPHLDMVRLLKQLHVGYFSFGGLVADPGATMAWWCVLGGGVVGLATVWGWLS